MEGPRRRVVRRRTTEELRLLLAQAAQDVLRHYPEARDANWDVRLSSSRRLAGYFREPSRPGRPALVYISRSVVGGDPSELRKTLAHEMGHLLQYLDAELPGGEKACDLLWLSRCGADFPRPPTYLSIGKLRWEWVPFAPRGQTLAQEAWRRRGEGLRNYIAWWESAMKDGPGRGDLRGDGPPPPEFD